MSDTYSVDPYAQFLGPQAPPQAPPSVSAPSPTIMAESGNNPYARNPNSSAAGPGQFIDSTWLSMINKYRPDLANGRSSQDILALRTDPKYADLSKSMTNAYAAENSVALSNAGLQPSAGNTYLAHFAGPDGAVSVLKSDPNTPVSKVLSPAAIKANPFLANMTTGQLQQWAAGRIGQSTPSEGYYGGRMHVTVPAGQQSTNDPYAQFTAVNGSPNVSTGGALLEGALSGVSANFRDEIYGASQASGLPGALGGFRAPVGAARLAYEHMTGQPGEATQAYNEAVAQMRARQATAQQEHPLAYGAGQLGGAVGGMLLAPGSAAATLPGRIAQGAAIGGAYGAVSGAGEGTDLQSRATGALTGATSGAIGGGVAAPLGEAVGAVGKLGYSYGVKPIVSVARGLINPDKEAARRVVGGITSDVRAGRGGLTPKEWLDLHAAGEPVMIADLGGPTARNLLRSAHNTSPEAEGAISDVVEPRFNAQNVRIADTIRKTIANGANATKSQAQLEAEYNAERVPAYKKAYSDGDKPIWSPELERLSSSPTVQGAMRSAESKWKDWQIIDGYGAANPPVKITPDGQFIRTGGSGLKTYPNLQYWDYVSRELAGAAAAARRAGNNSEAARFGGLEKALKSQLDDLVPAFKQARGTAAEFFGGNNALEAGAEAVKFKGDPIQVKVQMNKMKGAEAALFQEGFANKLAEQVEASGDRTNLTNKIFNSPQSRRLIRTILGDAGADKIEMRMRIENIYQMAHTALGNSTTAKQLIQSGLAGGALGAYLEGHDFLSAVTGFEHGAGIGAGIRLGGNKIVGLIDQRTAQKVGELLSSSDLNELRKGINIAANNQRIGNAIRLLDNRLSTYLGASGGNKAVGLLPQGIVPSGAQQQQQQ